MRVTSQDISLIPWYVPPIPRSHLLLEVVGIIGDTGEWNEILFALTTECGLTKQDVENLDIRELLDYLQVCNKVLSTKVAQHQKLEQEVAQARSRRRR